MIPSELADLINGLRWLGEQGRSGAYLAKAHIDTLPEDEVNLEEALGWLEDILEGKL